MSLRCGCPNQADDIVFGSIHECLADPSLTYLRDGMPVKAPRVAPTWMSMVPHEPAWTTTLGPDEVCE